MRLALSILCLLWIALVASAQPIWEDVSPLPGHDIAYLTERITAATGIWCVVCMDSGDCWSQNYRPFYSSDGGDTWEMRDNGINGADNLGVRIVDINPINPDILLAKSAGPQVPPYRSSDRGLNWDTTAIPQLPYGSISFRAGWFPDGVHAYAFSSTFEGGPHDYFLSTDTGQTWTFIDDLPDSYLYPFFMDERLPGFLLLSGYQVSTSWDYGQTWEGHPQFPFHDIRFGGPGVLPGQIYGTVHFIDGEFPDYTRYRVPCFSADTGRTWDFLNPADTLRWPIPGRPVPRILPDSSTAGHLFFMRTDSIFESRDDGQSWEFLWTGPGEIHQFLLLGYAPEWDRLYVAATNEVTGPWPPGLWRMTRGQSADDRHSNAMTSSFELSVYPNPFNATETLSLVLPFGSHTVVEISNALGRHVATLHDGMLEAGEHRFTFDASALPWGIYFARVKAGEFVQTQKLLLLK